MRKYDVQIQATYIGKDRNMGFIPGLSYRGTIKGNNFYPDGHLPMCPYSVSGFLTFWTNIHVIYRNEKETLRISRGFDNTQRMV